MIPDEISTDEDPANKEKNQATPEVTTHLKEEPNQFADVEQEMQVEQAAEEEKPTNSTSIDAAVVKTIEEHASIDDPVEPPARNAPKHTTMTTGASNDASKDMDVDIPFFPINSKSILSRLFDPDRKQKPQLWEHIKLVAPGPADQPPPGHIKWRSKDAVSAYCLKCRKQFTYTKGTSKTVRYDQANSGTSWRFCTP